MLNILSNILKPKDFYDLDAALQVAGLSESNSKKLCDLIDSHGRTKLQVRKMIAQIFNKQSITVNEILYLQEEVPHIFKKSFLTSVKFQHYQIDFYAGFVGNLNINFD